MHGGGFWEGNILPVLLTLLSSIALTMAPRGNLPLVKVTHA